MHSCSCLVDVLLRYPLDIYDDRYYKDRLEFINKGRPTPKMPNLTAECNVENRTFTVCFKEKAYEDYLWLTGCPVRNKLYCWPCVLFSTQNTMWSRHGYKDLNNLYKSLEKHDANQNHMNCLHELQTFGDDHSDDESIYDEFCDEDDLEDESCQNEQDKVQIKINRHNEQVKENRYILSCFVNAVCFLAKQELSFRAYFDGGECLNPGHYAELLRFTAEYDNKLKRYFKAPVFRCIYPQMQDELIVSVSSVLTNFIREEMSKTKFVSIILNETRDKSLISLCLRYVNNKDDIIERFLKLIDVRVYKTTSAVFDVLDKVICEFGVAGKLICQTYDGAPVLQALGGLQAKIKQKYPQVLFIHSYSNDLDFTLQQSSYNIKKCANFLKLLSGIGLFFLAAPERITALTNYMTRTTTKVPPTDLEFSTKLVQTVKYVRTELIGFFENIVENPDEFDSESVLMAGGCAGFLKSFETCFLLDIFCDIFSITDSLFSDLQKYCYHIAYCCARIKLVTTILKQKREKDFIIFFESAYKNSSMKLPEKRKNVDPTILYKKLFCEIVDNVLVQIADRFGKYKNFEFITLLDHESFENMAEFPEKAFKCLMDTYKVHFDSRRLRDQLEEFYSEWGDAMRLRNKPLPLLHKRMKILSFNDPYHRMSEVYKLMQLIITLPTTVKPTFSSLEKSKSFASSILGRERPAMAQLYVEKELLHKLKQKPSYGDKPSFMEKVIEKFCLQTKRKEFIYRQAAAKVAESGDGASTSWRPSYDNIKHSLYNTREKVENKGGKSGFSASEQNSEDPNPLPVGNDVIIPDVERQCFEMETESRASTSLMSNSDILVKQEIIETELESNVFDDSSFHSSIADGPSETHFDVQTPSTSFLTHSESSNSNAGIHPGGQVQDDSTAPTLICDLKAVKVESDVSANSCGGSSENNGIVSSAQILPSVLNATGPESSIRAESIQSRVPFHTTNQLCPPVLIISPESLSCNEPIQHGVPSRVGLPSMPQVLNSTGHGNSCFNEPIQPGVQSQLGSPLPSRDKFDAFGEFIASKLRNLDAKSSVFVQTAFADLIFKAELGMFLNRRENSISTSRTNDIQKDTPTIITSLEKENIQPRIPSRVENPYLPPELNVTAPESSTRNEPILPKMTSRIPDPPFPLVLSKAGPESTLSPQPIQFRMTSNIRNPWPSPLLNDTTPGRSPGNIPIQTRVSSVIRPSSIPSVSIQERSWSSMPIQSSGVPFHMRPRDEYDAYGEFAASKLRILDPRSCAFVQTAFADLIFEAELGRFLSEGEKSIFANKTNDILQNMPPVNDSELSSLKNVVSNLSRYEAQPQRNLAPQGFYAGQVPLEIIPNLHSVHK